MIIQIFLRQKNNMRRRFKNLYRIFQKMACLLRKNISNEFLKKFRARLCGMVSQEKEKGDTWSLIEPPRFVWQAILLFRYKKQSSRLTRMKARHGAWNYTRLQLLQLLS